MNEDLKPCPFCGANVFIFEIKCSDGKNLYRSGLHYADCIFNDKPIFFDTEEQLIETWNRRAENEQTGS